MSTRRRNGSMLNGKPRVGAINTPRDFAAEVRASLARPFPAANRHEKRAMARLQRKLRLSDADLDTPLEAETVETIARLVGNPLSPKGGDR